jgi:hypothetical protein
MLSALLIRNDPGIPRNFMLIEFGRTVKFETLVKTKIMYALPGGKEQ